MRMIKVRRMRWAGHIAQMGRRGIRIGYWWGKPEGKKPLGKPRFRWMDNIKLYLRETEWDGMDWIDLAQDRDQWRAFLNAVSNFRVP
jgi:hypothetical protein